MESYTEDEWIDETTAFDRLYSVATHISEPHTISEIAEQAHVAENTARSHLQRLESIGVLQSGQQERATVYCPDPLHFRMLSMREMLDKNDLDGLIELRATLQERVEEWQEEYGVERPDALRKRASKSETAAETREYVKIANDWELALSKLSVLSEAIEHYEAYSQSFLDDTEGKSLRKQAENHSVLTSDVDLGAVADALRDVSMDGDGRRLFDDVEEVYKGN